jgi:hypothetical protein
MGVFQLSNRGLHPLGQLESGILVPLIGAREATVIGGAIVSLMTLVTVWRVPAISRFRWNEEDIRHGEARDSADDAAEKLKEAPAQMRESP